MNAIMLGNMDAVKKKKKNDFFMIGKVWLLPLRKGGGEWVGVQFVLPILRGKHFPVTYPLMWRVVLEFSTLK